MILISLEKKIFLQKQVNFYYLYISLFSIKNYE